MVMSYEMGELEFEPRVFGFKIHALDHFLYQESMDLLCTGPKVKFSSSVSHKITNWLMKVAIVTMQTSGHGYDF